MKLIVGYILKKKNYWVGRKIDWIISVSKNDMSYKKILKKNILNIKYNTLCKLLPFKKKTLCKLLE